MVKITLGLLEPEDLLGALLFLLMLQLLSIPFWAFFGFKAGISANAILLFLGLMVSSTALNDIIEEREKKL